MNTTKAYIIIEIEQVITLDDLEKMKKEARKRAEEHLKSVPNARIKEIELRQGYLTTKI